METATIRRITLVLIPYLMICYLVSFVDRVNVGFAALDMNKELGFTASIFGLGGGLFFLSYFLFEVPSNLAMQQIGARRWLARIMITWGIISACTAFVSGPWSFYCVRFLLGAAEAGFFPGVILYLTYWFPAAYRARIVSMFYVAVPLSSFVGSPISAALLGLEGLGGFHGWQWLFLLEGLPAVVLGLITYLILPDRPKEARFLSVQQRLWLSEKLQTEQLQSSMSQKNSLSKILLHPQILLLAIIYAGSSAASNGLSLWQPQILKSFGVTNMQAGFINSVPFAFAAIAMIFWSRQSDFRRERFWSTALPLGLSALAMGCCLLTTSLIPTVALLSLTLIGTYAFKGPFWALSTETMTAGSAAVGLAAINAIGNLAGFGGTYLIGIIRDATGSYSLALLPLVILEVIGCALLLVMRKQRSQIASNRQLV
jgi:ACS family tartrate transporter-like MFS transporter